MDKTIVFISGIHGVGKTTFCNFLEKKTGIKSYSAGTLINNYKNNPIVTKEVDDVNGNQDILLSAINYLINDKSFFLDGHFCLLNKNNSIQEIPFKTFSDLFPKLIIVLLDDIIAIKQRLFTRDGKIYDISILDKMQNKEISYSTFVASSLNIPIIHQDVSQDYAEVYTLLESLDIGGKQL